MAYAPDEITLNDYPKSYNENIKEQKNKSLKKLKKETFKGLLYFHWIHYRFTSNIINLKKLRTKETNAENIC